jgi:hypothetical protein
MHRRDRWFYPPETAVYGTLILIHCAQNNLVRRLQGGNTLRKGAPSQCGGQRCVESVLLAAGTFSGYFILCTRNLSYSRPQSYTLRSPKSKVHNG